MYADTITDSMRRAIDETARRRELQIAYNEEHGITPTTIRKAVRDLISTAKEVAETEDRLGKNAEDMNAAEIGELIEKLDKQMRLAAAELDFETAADLRDRITELKVHLGEAEDADQVIRSLYRKKAGKTSGKNSGKPGYRKKRRYNRGGKV
jgi:excinuclease ABC subunit B